MNGSPTAFHKILSPREQEILRYIGQGFPNEEIAQFLGLRASSVSDHKKNIMQKVGVHTAPELMRYAIDKGFSKL